MRLYPAGKPSLTLKSVLCPDFSSGALRSRLSMVAYQIPSGLSLNGWFNQDGRWMCLKRSVRSLGVSSAWATDRQRRSPRGSPGPIGSGLKSAENAPRRSGQLASRRPCCAALLRPRSVSFGGPWSALVLDSVALPCTPAVAGAMMNASKAPDSLIRRDYQIITL